MKLSMIFLAFALSGQVFAEKPRLGQDSDPVGGDNSRCCKTGACTNLVACKDTQLSADRGNHKGINKVSPSAKSKGNQAQ